MLEYPFCIGHTVLVMPIGLPASYLQRSRLLFTHYKVSCAGFMTVYQS